MPASPRSVLREARALVRLATDVLAREEPDREAIRAAHTQRHSEVVDAELAKIPIARLRDASDGRLRTAPLEAGGYTTVRDVLRADPVQLDRVPGMGEKSATQAISVAHNVASAVA